MSAAASACGSGFVESASAVFTAFSVMMLACHVVAAR
jgi:hypothetical protein